MSERQQRRKQAFRATQPPRQAALKPTLPIETAAPKVPLLQSWTLKLRDVLVPLHCPPDPGVQIWHYVLLAAIPGILTLLNRNWLFQNGPHMDPWYYFGHFQHFPRFHNIGRGYPGERIVWIFPGWILTHLFGQVPGVVILHFAVFLSALFGLYYVLVRLTDAQTALTTSVFFGFNAYFVGPNGWDYPEGLAWVFLLLAFAFVIQNRTSWTWLILSAMAWFGVIYTYLAWILFTPAYMYVMFRSICPGAAPSRAWRTLASTAMGAVLMTLACWAAYAVLGGQGFFFRANILEAIYLGTKLTGNPWIDPEWIHRCTWLIFPVLAALMSAAALLPAFRKRTGGAPFLAFYLFCFAVMVFMTIRPNRLLAFDYRTSILLPGFCLVFALVLFRVPAETTRLQWLLVTACGAVLSIAPLDSRLVPLRPVPIVFVLGLAVALLALSYWNLAKPGGVARWASLALLFSGISFSTAPPDTSVAWRTSFKGPEIYERTSRALKIIAARTPATLYPSFWISSLEYRARTSAEFRGVMSGFIAHGLSMWYFPAVDKLYPAGSRLLLLTEQRDVVAGSAYNAAQKRMPAAVVSQDRISYGDFAYWITQLEILPYNLANLRQGFAEQTVLDYSSVPKPLVLTHPGIYQFELSGMTVDAQLQFGVLQRDRKTWLDNSGPPITEGGRSILWFRLAVAAGEPVTLAVRDSSGMELPPALSRGLKLSILRDADPSHTPREFDRLVSRPFGNLMQNASFEDGAVYWNWVQGDLHAGSNCFHGGCVEYLASGPSQFVTGQRGAELEPGKQYELSVWMRANNGSETYLVGPWDSTAQQWVTSQSVTVHSEWTQFRLPFTARTTHTVMPRFQNTQNSPTAISFDEVILTAHPARP
jgi:hypothetical protein